VKNRKYKVQMKQKQNICCLLLILFFEEIR